MPRIEDYELFREELEEFMRHAKASHMPNLVPLIYITRSKYTLSKPFIAGRPNIGNIYQQLCKDRPVNQAGLVFACGPQPLVSELYVFSFSGFICMIYACFSITGGTKAFKRL